MIPSLSWEEVLLFSMDFTVSQNFFEFVLQDENFSLKKLDLAFLTACVYWFLNSLKSCISRGYSMLTQNATGCICAGQGQSSLERTYIWKGLEMAMSVPGSTFFNGACLFKMMRMALLKNNQASSTDGMRVISFQDTRAR